MMSPTHDHLHLIWIEEQMRRLAVYDYRFCVENDCYVCDRNGNFFSVCVRQRSRSGNTVEKYGIRKLNGSFDRYGYTTYRITVDGVKKHLKAHRMMLNAWVGEKRGLVVNHKDGNKTNNALYNLEWCTVAENNDHAIKTGLFDPFSQKGKLRKIPSYDWVAIYILHKNLGYSLSELGRMNGCAHDTIKNIILKLDRILPEAIRNAGK